MYSTKTTFNTLLAEVNALLQAHQNKALQPICTLLQSRVEHYNWVGFYFMNNQRQVLEVGPYAGEITDHTVIPFGRGICGQVAVGGKTIEVPNVQESTNYLACSIKTKAEIVVPLFKNNHLVGQLDIDSHELNPFTQEDHDFLNAVCQKVALVLP